MPSASLRLYQTTRAATLDEIEAAHASVGGAGRGRRYATQQVNHAYVVLLSGQFQGFCRDLHSEGIDAVVRATAPATLQVLVKNSLLRNRQIDRGNPNASNIGSDFGRFDFAFWAAVDALRSQNASRKRLLDELNEWRNAIAHQDFSRVSGTVQLQQVRRWRSVCNNLAADFDHVVYQRLAILTGVAPW